MFIQLGKTYATSQGWITTPLENSGNQHRPFKGRLNNPTRDEVMYNFRGTLREDKTHEHDLIAEHTDTGREATTARLRKIALNAQQTLMVETLRKLPQVEALQLLDEIDQATHDGKRTVRNTLQILESFAIQKNQAPVMANWFRQKMKNLNWVAQGWIYPAALKMLQNPCNITQTEFVLPLLEDTGLIRRILQEKQTIHWAALGLLHAGRYRWLADKTIPLAEIFKEETNGEKQHGPTFKQHGPTFKTREPENNPHPLEPRRLLIFLQHERERRQTSKMEITIWNSAKKLVQSKKNNLFDYADWARISNNENIQEAASLAASQHKHPFHDEALQWISSRI